MVLNHEWTSLMKYMPKHWIETLRSYNCMELRVRVGKPVQVIEPKHDVVLSVVATQEDLQHLVSAFSGSSLYAFEEELKQGFITLPGGHRVGFSGKALLDNAGMVRGLKYISSVCLRVARSVPGCADRLMTHILDSGGNPYNTLLISPPQAGKTTLLRDIARQLSCRGKRVCVIDERSEIAGCFQGQPQLDVGPRTDVLDGCPKAQGMLMALRSLSPEVLVTDEIGRVEDALAIEEALNSGVRVVATAHGCSYEDVAMRPGLSRLIDMGLFQRIAVLSIRQGPGTIEYIGAPATAKGVRYAHSR